MFLLYAIALYSVLDILKVTGQVNINYISNLQSNQCKTKIQWRLIPKTFEVEAHMQEQFKMHTDEHVEQDVEKVCDRRNVF